MATSLGLDWGGRGWVVVWVRAGSDADGADRARFGAAFAPSILNVWRTWRDEVDRLLVDVPIGLPTGSAAGMAPPDEPIVRACDRAAKEFLGAGRRSSVFDVPCREALTASNYRIANETNRLRLGRGLSTQAWAIAPRILEVDGFLREFETARPVVREAHPEVCFAALGAGDGGVDDAKTTDDGRATRLETLSEFSETASSPWKGDLREQYEALEKTHIDDLERHERRIHASNRDDLLDAFVLAVTGQATDLQRLPSVSDRAVPTDDETGFPMEIVYHEPMQ